MAASSDDRGWEDALAHFYASRELQNVLDLYADHDDLQGQARVGGCMMLTLALDSAGNFTLLPRVEMVEEILIRDTAVIHGADSRGYDRQLGALIDGTICFVQWWANVLLGVHPEVLADRSAPAVTRVLDHVHELRDSRDAIIRRCTAAVEGTRAAIRLKETGTTVEG